MIHRANRVAVGRHTGFSLVEVLVALIVISVGLLGVAKIQALALSNTASARLRSLAAIQAASLASTMHADRAYWAVTPSNTVTATAGGLATATDTALTAAISAASTANATDPTQYCVQGAVNSVAPCQPVQLAAADVQTWVNDLATLMGPSAQANIACDNSTPLVCNITISWTERVMNITQQSVNKANQFTNSSYTLYVQP